MSKYIRLRTPLLIALAASVAACSKDNGNGALTQDSSLSRDLALAGSDSAAQPQLQDVPAGTAPTTTPAPAPAPAPARAPTASVPRTRPAASAPARPRPTTPPPRPTSPPAPTTTPSGNTATPTTGGTGAAERGNVGTIAAGSLLHLTSNSRVCTNTNKVGERFTATLSDAITGSNGATIPAGATATVEITQLDRSENATDKIKMGFRVVSVTFGGRTYAVAATTESADVSRVRNQPASKDRQKVIGGAIAGAIAGQILGKDTKGTIIGAAAGAAAGAGAAAATANYEGCLNEGATLNARLTDATQVRIS
jgi:hypothetical protein